MKVIKLSILAAAMVVTGISTVKAQTADEVMQKHIAAIGGMDNWNKLKTVKMTGSMSQQGFEIAIVQTVDMSKGMRMDISVMGKDGYQIITEKGGWAYMPFMGSEKVDTMKAEDAKATWSKLDIKGHQLIDYKTRYTKVELGGKDTVNNALCYQVKCTDKEGNETTCSIDATTYYLVRSESKVKINEEEQEVATAYANYQKQEGDVIMPMSVSAQGAEITFKTIEINKPIDPNIFVPVAVTTK